MAVLEPSRKFLVRRYCLSETALQADVPAILAETSGLFWLIRMIMRPSCGTELSRDPLGLPEYTSESHCDAVGGRTAAKSM